MTRVSCYTIAPRSPLPRRAACFTSHRAAPRGFFYVESAAGFSDGGRVPDPKTHSFEKKGASAKDDTDDAFSFLPPSPKKKPKSLPSTLTQPTKKSFFLHFFHSLLSFVSKIHFFCVRVGLCLSLSELSSVLASPLHWYKIVLRC